MEGLSPGVTRYHLERFHPLRYIQYDLQNQLLGKAQLIGYDQGDFIFSRQDPGLQTYYLLTGTVEIRGSFFSRSRIDAYDSGAQFPLEETLAKKAWAIAKSNVNALVFNPRHVDFLLTCSEAVDHYYPRHNSDKSQAPLEQEALTSDHDWIWKLLNSPLFSRIPHSNIEQMFTLFEDRLVSQGEEIISEGDEGQYFYVIKEGRTKIRLDKGDSLIRDAGDYFGEDTLVDDTPRSTTVTMLTNGKLARLQKTRFRELLHDAIIAAIDPEQATNLKSSLGQACELIDIRLDAEFAHQEKPGFINIPLNELRQNLTTLDPDKIYIIGAEGGRRSELAALWMQQAGLKTRLIRIH